MILEIGRQVPTPQTCRRLKDAGFPEDTYFVWTGKSEVPQSRRHEEMFSGDFIPAPTAAELGYIMRRHVRSSLQAWEPLSNEWEVISSVTGDKIFPGYSEAEGRALLLLDLIKRGIIDLQDTEES